ncbi:hypothetical protein Vafri_4924 [Volvox africanus]|uniref:Uncharacterized protein n=1 Tax=Volvox africanus TaxID=51714 RepID=A0A8J4AUP5_9CHLO|nr:hypothetical protein Vafri_4924 [Volvox africanus]
MWYSAWHTYCLKPPMEGAWVCPRCAGKEVTGEQLQARHPGSSHSMAVRLKHLKELEGAAFMREQRGRGKRGVRQMGIASYAGRQGASHRFQVIYEDGVVGLLGLPGLHNRLPAICDGGAD